MIPRRPQISPTTEAASAPSSAVATITVMSAPASASLSRTWEPSGARSAMSGGLPSRSPPGDPGS